MKCIKYSLITILTFLFFTSYSQQQEINFLHDTVTIGKSDSIFYQIGDSVKGELKYGSNTRYYITKIDSGYVSQKRWYWDGQITREWNYSKGSLHGRYRLWGYNEILVVSGHYYHGLADSIWTFYNEYGIIESQGLFLPDSNYLIENFIIDRAQMDEWGDLFYASRVEKWHSPPHGKWKFYDSKGHLIKVLEFNKGVVISMKFDDW